MLREPLIDGHGRRIADVRVSVTDRCNFRCQYCMPAEGLPWLDRDSLLSYEEIARLVALQRVDRDVDAINAGVDERSCIAFEQVPIGRHRQVVDAIDRREHRDEPREVASH